MTEKLKTKINKLNEQIQALKARIVKKDEKLNQHKSKRIYTDLAEKNEELRLKNIDLRRVIVKKQEIGCFECKDKNRLVPYSNFSICLKCLNEGLDKYYEGN